ncbi:MAG: extracellular solute-binding protein [Oscillospiraceae bacterium]|jgi:ABC-type glycerol-3-phosphate transport system substrate-binding protein|nr:extracellular solute-binding protein [Oscillospiraceae bacterium]
MRSFIFVLVILIISITIIGCDTLIDDDKNRALQVELFQLPEDIGEITTVVVENDLVYISTIWHSDNGTSTIPKIFTVNLDGTDLKELSNFIPTPLPSDKVRRYMNIEKMVVDKNGNIYIFEFSIIEAEEFSMVQNIRKLDNLGNEVNSLDLNNFIHDEIIFRIVSFEVDNEENIYLLTIGATGVEILVLDKNGNMFHRIFAGDMALRQLVTIADGSIAVYGQTQSGNISNILLQIDIKSDELGTRNEIPNDANPLEVFQGSGGFDVFFVTENDLYGINFEDNEAVQIINLMENRLTFESVKNTYITKDNRAIIFYTGERLDLPEQNGEATTLTLATVGGWSWSLRVRELVIEFNRTNADYFIEMVDYADFGTHEDIDAGLLRLSREMITGNPPDILFIENIPFDQWASRGFFVDLNKLIDSDTELNRSDFIESVLNVSEINGGLYSLFSLFDVNTIVGNAEVLGAEMGWSLDEFISILDANPQADLPMGMWTTRNSFFTNTIRANLDKYINWTTGEVNFDNEEFIKLLELSMRFPDEIDWEMDGLWAGDPWASEWFGLDDRDFIMQGRTIMRIVPIGNFDTIRALISDFYSSDIVYKGFPADGRIGNMLITENGFAITTQAKSIDGAWQFLRMSLDERWQHAFSTGGFPIIRTYFDSMLEDYLRDRNQIIVFENDDDEDDVRVIEPLNDADIDLFFAMLDSLSGTTNQNQTVVHLILESAVDFWNGRSTVQDAIRVIQSRVSIFVSELS